MADLVLHPQSDVEFLQGTVAAKDLERVVASSPADPRDALCVTIDSRQVGWYHELVIGGLAHRRTEVPQARRAGGGWQVRLPASDGDGPALVRFVWGLQLPDWPEPELLAVSIKTRDAGLARILDAAIKNSVIYVRPTKAQTEPLLAHTPFLDAYGMAIGLDYHTDELAAAVAWLEEHGDPA